MPTIDHGDILDIRVLAELAKECDALIEDADSEDADADEVAEARETLEKLASFCADLGYSVDAEDPEAVSDQLTSIGDNEPTLIAEDHFVDYCEELCKDIGDLPSELPWYISNHIDWNGVADTLKQDYSEVELDGETYLTRAY
jgi:hypothetical protein